MTIADECLGQVATLVAEVKSLFPRTTNKYIYILNINLQYKHYFTLSTNILLFCISIVDIQFIVWHTYSQR